ncbi:hypothetical protein PRK78_002755 [Emydomyces testavorans]|uniref:Hemerythrin-like domain-containing protein n=1 Tax=Emydomyces testavorans TaxID=2070801 RepID=A0AAF0DGE0_9EURO|nr:hypothetical protein PRK78_002755 [Emydomyces testavorans]
MSNPWADTPLSLISETGLESRPDIPPDHAAAQFAQRMACLHNTIFRSFNACYNQCLNVKKGTKDASDLLVYNQVLCEGIEHHHHVEEEYMFPGLEKLSGIEGLMDKNIQQHRDFEAGLKKLREYAFNTDASAYDGEKLKTILDILGPVLEKHLHAEISTLLDLSKYDSEKLFEVWELVAKKAEAGTDKFRYGVMMLACTDNTFLVDGKNVRYPPFPAFVPYLTKWVFQWSYSGAWRFAPCDLFGNPKPLAFLNPTLEG